MPETIQETDLPPGPAHDVAMVLDGAADLIETAGWCQRAFRETDGRRCIVAAIEDSAGLLGQARSGEGWSGKRWANAAVGAKHACRRALDESGPGRLRLLAAWNDLPDRTPAEAVALLRRAADSERPRDPGQAVKDLKAAAAKKRRGGQAAEAADTDTDDTEEPDG